MSFAFTDQDTQNLGDEEIDAIMEALIAAVMANRSELPAETARFVQEVERIPWPLGPVEVAERLERARQRILAARDPEVLVALVRSTATRVSGDALREKVVRAMGAIMFSGEPLLREEEGVLALYGAVFGIESERLDVIKADVQGAYSAR